MLSSFVACALCVFGLQADGPKAKPVEMIPVVFRVTIPKDTPKDAKVYLTGDLPAAGEWRADAHELKKIPDGRHAVTLLLPRGEALEFKFTLGKWELVEKDAKGVEIVNRKLPIDRNVLMDVDLEIGSWAVPGAASVGMPVVASAPAPVVKSTITGMVRVHDKFPSKVLKNGRAVIVWLPPGYADEPMRRYPVFYLQDGQNMFDARTAAFNVEWRADETADRLIRDKKVPPLILVAIESNKDRMNEYSSMRDEGHKAGGKGGDYVRFVVEELKPFIDRTYRTKPDRDNTAIGGSSLGGLVAMEATLDHPEVFGRCAAVSPSIGFANDHLLTEAKAKSKSVHASKFWIDMGTKEANEKEAESRKAVEKGKALAAVLKENGLEPERDYHFEIIEGARHQEADWAARFDRILLYLFPQ